LPDSSANKKSAEALWVGFLKGRNPASVDSQPAKAVEMASENRGSTTVFVLVYLNIQSPFTTCYEPFFAI
jgi:hypothetical protein